FINDISLAVVADDFLAHIRAFEDLPVKDTAHFLLVASTLVLIKSKSLLPALTLTEEEKGDIEDLEERLRVYKRVRGLSQHVKSRFGKNIIFAKMPSKHITPVFSPDEMTSAGSLLSAIKKVLASLPVKEVIEKTVVRKIISLEEVMDKLTQRITASISMSFREFSGTGKKERAHVIVSFLAMLELVKQGAISVRQEKNFTDINMESRNVGVPMYN
ncbi:MAG: segregation/condensation protein A, partial [Patescibacteria group bacterium]|nr:segregation/condensation protein A [Patescibacteria group bacterium]